MTLSEDIGAGSDAGISKARRRSTNKVNSYEVSWSPLTCISAGHEGGCAPLFNQHTGVYHYT
ncbi:uncharacterized protein PHALS_02585 [Plasmopara halstedii]|uniref:Uncharacterized protein n=1 Tax=Plasmopara halstedii TaxID=4781 RepID=A0A0P1AXC4_PLAHL|nr:uncharacterized protein PHALS_02585 [Plasmopara halstedii]CEG46169.1 hypothetical protein PHALS_02585 [Plasmopara halstedii]|eukprot:XP_024582538.1 hypothetical protein PHALS_02585 [Plasmopara halstedii]